MSSDSRLLSSEERADIIKDIMAQNEVILDQHRKKLEMEFQDQLKGMLTDMNTADDEEYDEDEDINSPSHPVVDSNTANLANEQFFHAAQDSHSAPQIHIYEGKQHTATVRASQETTAMGQDSKPAVVSSSNAKVVKNDAGPKKVVAPKSPTPARLQVYNQPFLRKSKSTVKKEAASKQKRLQDKQRDAEIEEKIRSQQLINRVSSPDGYGKSAEVDALMFRVHGGTKTALMKSSSLVEEMAKENKKILKKYQPRPLSTGDDNGYANFVDHSTSSPKSKTLPHQQTQQKGKGKKHQLSLQHKTHKKTNNSSSKGESNAGFLPPVPSSTPRQDEVNGTPRGGTTPGTTDREGGSSSTPQGKQQQQQQQQQQGKQHETMYVMQQQDDEEAGGGTTQGESVDPTLGGVFQDKRTWENQLARHILSVYASAQVEDVKKSRAVLEFVDLKSKTNSEDLVQEGLFDTSLLQEQKNKVMEASLRQPNTPKESKTGTRGGTGSSAGAGEDTTHGAEKKKSKKKNNKKKQLQFREDEIDPVATVGQDRLVATKTLDRKERDDINPLLVTEENKTTRVGLVRAPPKCFPIWFVSSGNMYAEWMSLPEGDKLQAYLDSLMEKRKYRNYLETVEGLLDTHWISAYYRQAESTKKIYTLDCGQKKKKTRAVTPPRRRRMDLTEIVHEEDPPLTTEELKVLYRQLLLVANAFAINSIEKKDFDSAMLIIRMAERWAAREELFEAESRLELKAFINQTLSYYFYRTKKAGAALNHTKLALAAFTKIGTDTDCATSLLHLACCHYQVGKFKAAHETIYKFLGMVEEGRIAFNETEPKELCLVAIAYHNLAVVQLKLQVPDVAAKSSQNARKIARLCLSYSNRWINTFHWTHQLCLADVKYELENNFKLTEEQVQAMNDLMKILYDPFPS